MSAKILSAKRSGFTLIELLLVIGIIAILASIVIVAINPTRQLGQARDAQRRADVNTIVNAIYQYSIDNNGSLPGALTGGTLNTEYRICKTTYGQNDSGCINNAAQRSVSLRMLSGSYVVNIPADPQAATGSGWTKYLIKKGSNSRITVIAVAEVSGNSGSFISVTR